MFEKSLRYIINSTVGFSLMILTACCMFPSAPPLLLEADKLPTHVAGASDSNIVTLQNNLIKHGVTIITMGQNYLISIPAIALFANQSPQLTWESYALLNEVACYLRQFRKVEVTVTAYSSPYVSAQREHSLTLARARNVGEYLWSQEINTRLIFTHGQGSDKPISVVTPMVVGRGDASLNARIEITFRRSIV